MYEYVIRRSAAEAVLPTCELKACRAYTDQDIHVFV